MEVKYEVREGEEEGTGGGSQSARVGISVWGQRGRVG